MFTFIKETNFCNDLSEAPMGSKAREQATSIFIAFGQNEATDKLKTKK